MRVRFANEDRPVLAVEHDDGLVEVLWPLDPGYSDAFDARPEREKRWSPSWGFHPDDPGMFSEQASAVCSRPASTLAPAPYGSY